MKKIFPLILAVYILSVSLTADAAGTASLSFSPSGGNYKVGDKFTVSIFANSSGGQVDTVRANVRFSSDLVEVQSFSMSSSFTLSSGGNSIDNNSGSLSYGGGIPGGTTSSRTLFGTANFRVKKAGQLNLTLSSDSLVLSDGENIFDGKSPSAVFTFAEPVPVNNPVQAPNPVTVQPDQAATQQNPVSEASQEIPAETATDGMAEDANQNPVSLVSESSGEAQVQQVNNIFRLFWAIPIILIALAIGLLIYIYRRQKYENI